MKFKEYQKNLQNHLEYRRRIKNIDKKMVYLSLGLMEEAGEVAQFIKETMNGKGARLDRLRKKEIIHEMGDVLWYLTQLGTELNIPLETIAKENLKKLSTRKKNGQLVRKNRLK